MKDQWYKELWKQARSLCPVMSFAQQDHIYTAGSTTIFSEKKWVFGVAIDICSLQPLLFLPPDTAQCTLMWSLFLCHLSASVPSSRAWSAMTWTNYWAGRWWGQWVTPAAAVIKTAVCLLLAPLGHQQNADAPTGVRNVVPAWWLLHLQLYTTKQTSSSGWCIRGAS